AVVTLNGIAERSQRGIADEAAEDSIGHARHGREHGGRRNLELADLERRRHTPAVCCANWRRIVPQLVGHGINSNKKASAAAEALAKPTSYFFAPAFSYLRRKRSTRPAVSTSFCLPVKNGWQLEQISTLISPL